MIDFSYETILQRLKDNLSSKLDDSNILFYSTNQRILEAIAEELAEEMRYDEYLTRESKWNTAQNASSIMNQLDFFNYRAHLKIGATGNLKISTNSDLNGTYSYRVPIPKFTQFSNGTLNFCSIESTQLYSSDPFTFVSVAQGTRKTESFTISASNILANGAFVKVENENFENTYYEVKVNGLPWTEVDYFIEAESSDASLYTTRVATDFSGMEFYFGNDLLSKAVKIGDIVSITYLETEGDQGEVLSTNNITRVSDTIYDSRGVSIDLYCSNVSTSTDSGLITGGRDTETIESIKENAPYTFKIGSRVITRTDYLTIINGANIPDKLEVWGELETNVNDNLPPGTFIPLSENVINVVALTISEETGTAEPLNQTQKNTIQEAVEPLKSLTDLVQFVEPKITYFDVYSGIRYKPTDKSSAEVQQTVNENLEDAYSIQNTSFGQSLYFSQYYALINNSVGVEYHETEIILYQLETFSGESGSTYVFELNLLHNDIRPTTDPTSPNFVISIKSTDETLTDDHPYKDWFPIGADDGSGGITSYAVPDYSGVPDYGSTFDIVADDTSELYTKGSIDSITVNNGIPDDWQNSLQIKIQFKTGTTTTEIIPREKYQIFALGDINLTMIGII